jgi:glycine C-acetyltransferase
MRLSRPLDKAVYRHCDMDELRRRSSGVDYRRGARHRRDRRHLQHARRPRAAGRGHGHRRTYDDRFEENVVVIVDDSHGVGAFGTTGRGTEEYTAAPPSDVLIATLGKALGVNGGYVTSNQPVIRFLRETSPMYIYSNPITPAEASAALAALDMLDSDTGRALLDRLRALTRRFEDGLVRLGFEIIPGEHPVVPLMVRDTARTRALVRHLRANGVLATGLAFPVVPRGDEEIRFQVNADHTEGDIDEVLDVLSRFEA